MFGVFDVTSVDRHSKSIDFVEYTGERHHIVLRSSSMAKRVRECVIEQSVRRVTAAQLDLGQDGRKSLKSAGIANYEGALIPNPNGQGHFLRCVQIRANGVKMLHQGLYPVEFVGPFDRLSGPILASVEGYLDQGKVIAFRTALTPLPTPTPDARPAAE